MTQLNLVVGALALILGVGALVRRAWLQRFHVQLRQLEQLATAGTLAAGAIHEAKNPLTGIVGFAQMGQHSSDLQEMREYFALIEQDALRANQILEGMLDFTRPTQAAAFEAIGVQSLVESALALTRHQLEKGQVTLKTQWGASLPSIRADAGQMRQVLINLMLNAQHAVADSKVKEVTVITELKDGVRIVIQDSGPGFSAEAQGRAFDAFFTTKPRGQGTGLGLTISKRLVVAHGGTLRIESAPGGGARVVITLPPGA